MTGPFIHPEGGRAAMDVLTRVNNEACCPEDFWVAAAGILLQGTHWMAHGYGTNPRPSIDQGIAFIEALNLPEDYPSKELIAQLAGALYVCIVTATGAALRQSRPGEVAS